MLSLDNIDFINIKKPSKQVFHDSWKFKVTLPKWDITNLFNAIADNPYVNQNTVDITYDGDRCQAYASFEVMDQAFAEFMKDFIARERGWFYTMRACPSYTTTTYTEEDFKVDYKHILSSLSGLPTDASDKEHAESIIKEDIKMSKVKTQAPTWYSSYRKFTKVIRSGPVTVAWIDGKKVMIRKTKKDKDDPEKAMLMLYAKSQFSSEAAFHRWFRDQTKLFEEANKNAKN